MGKFLVVVVVVVALSTLERNIEGRFSPDSRGVIIWLVNFYCARRAPFLRGSLRRCHVRPCQPLLRATLISLLFFSVTLSPRNLSFSSLFLFLWHRFTYRNKDLSGILVRDASGTRVSGTLFPAPFVKGQSFVRMVFRGKSS